MTSLFGIAIVALPAGIVTVGFVDETQLTKEHKAARAAARPR